MNSRLSLAALLLGPIVWAFPAGAAPRAQDTVVAAAGTRACRVGPIVSDLDRSARFYHDVLGLQLEGAAERGRLPWNTDRDLLHLHGLPNARIRLIDARMPGEPCGVELVEFAQVERRSVRRRVQDPGAAMLILVVRDIDAIFSRVKAAGTPVLTTGGAPMLVGPAKTARGVIVQDPDGHPIEVAQLEPSPPTTATADSNVIGIRLRITVSDSGKAAAFYRRTLGIDMTPGAFTDDASVMAMMGLPETARYRVGVSTLPDSALTLELIEFAGAGSARELSSRLQDPGSYRLAVDVRDIDATVTALTRAGARVLSTGGTPVRMTSGSDRWRRVVVQDPDNLFVVVQQRVAG